MNQPVATGPEATSLSRGRRVAAWLAIAALGVCLVIGSNVFTVRERLVGSALPDEVRPATSRVVTPASSTEAEPTALRSAPWWQTVTSVDGEAGSTSVPITIDRSAVDWRVTWSCDEGHLEVRSSEKASAIVDADCPEGVGFGSATGPTELEVTADGPWSIEVAQRINLPLVERLLPAMTDPGTKVVATGTFRKVERVGAGKVTIYETDSGYSVRLEDFWVNPKSALQLRLSEATSPRTAEEFLRARSQLLANLDVTAGSLNYESPTGVDPVGFPTAVIWSPSDKRVYAVARLEGAE